MDNENSVEATNIDTVGGNEIITICVGGCGINMGTEYFSTIMNEHQINKDGSFTGNKNSNTSKINPFFRHRSKYDQYTPRVLFFDLDETAITKVKTSYLGSLVDSENFQHGPYGSGVLNWAKGHYTEGAEMIDTVVESIRNETEICDTLQGFNIFHSICGGSGGGLGTLALIKIRDNYPDRVIMAHSVIPSRTAHSNVASSFEMYNSMLSFHVLIENCDINFHIDNASIIKMCTEKCGVKNVTYDDINWIISLICSGCTACFRFDTEPAMITNMKKMYTFHTSYPRLHFLSAAHSPYFMFKNYKYNDKVDEIINDSLYGVSGIEFDDGKVLSCSVCYRGNGAVAMDKMNEYVSNFKQKFREDFVTWNPFLFGSCYVLDNNECYKKYTSLLVTSIINSSGINNNINFLIMEYQKLYRRKAFLHWYKGEGMDEMEFQEAAKNVRDLCDEYKEKASIELDDNDDVKDDK